MDIGQWDKTDYKFKTREYLNKVEREEIMIQRWELEKREISLKIANFDLNIAKAKEKQLEFKKQADWCKEKMDKWET